MSPSGGSYTAPVMGKRKGPKGGETTVTAGGLQRVGVLLTGEQYQALRRGAFDRGASVSELVREAVDEYLERLREGKR